MNIGIFGGSFNPIHIGHLIAAEEVFQQRALSKIIFVPTGISPHKDASNLIAPAHRYQMIKEAIGDNGHFELSDVETKRPGRSYTVDTVRAFKEIYGEENNLYLIVGTDMINDISTWKDVDVLSRMCSFIVIDRFPVPLQEAAGADKPRGIAIFPPEKRREIERLKVTIPPIGVSSSEIRDRLKRGAGIRYLTPRCVEDYIKRNSLYGKGLRGEDSG